LLLKGSLISSQVLVAGKVVGSSLIELFQGSLDKGHTDRLCSEQKCEQRNQKATYKNYICTYYLDILKIIEEHGLSKEDGFEGSLFERAFEPHSS